MGENRVEIIDVIHSIMRSVGLGAPELSIIVPVYNAMPYFVECVDSVLSQNLDKSCYELILVDDGSTDGSGAYCDEVAGAYSNVTVVHEENSGYAARPRNVGLAHAKGKYVLFADADDTLYPEALTKMLDYARKSKCDIGLFKVDARDWETTYAGLFDEARDHCTFTDTNLEDFYGCYRLVRRSLIEKNHIRYIEGINPEDWAFALESYLCAGNICVVNDQYYYRWRKRPDGNSLSLGNLSSSADEWSAKLKGYKAYVDVALKYDALDRYPQIMLRLCREIAKRAADASRGICPYEVIEAFGDFSKPYYTDSVRALMPISVLLVNDAIQQGVSVEKLADLLPIDDRVNFWGNGNGQSCYRVFFKDGTDAFTATMPAGVGVELGAPKYSYCRVDQVAFENDALTMAGSLFILRAWTSNHVSAYASWAAYGAGRAFRVPAEVIDCSVEVAYGNVRAIRLKWRSNVSFDKLVSFAALNGKRTDLDPSLVVVSGEQESKHRLGKCRSEDADLGYKTGELIAECIKPMLTGYDNFRLRIDG